MAEQTVEINVWQEYDCPGSGIDFDLYDGEVLFLGQSCHCSGCGGEHKAGPGEVVNETTINAGEGLRFYGIPRDREELNLWISQAKQRPAA